MKKLICIIFPLITLTFVSCDKVEFPVVFESELDTSLYPGNFLDYEYPEFGDNPNTDKNILIADYTGHKCSFCPPAAAKAEEIKDANPDRVFIAAIHGSAEVGGYGDFQKTDALYARDFTNPIGLEMASTFFQMGIGFFGNPSGNVSRVANEDGKFFFPWSDWGDISSEVLASELNVNIQAKSAYFPETKGVYLHTDTEFLNDMNGTFNIVTYIIEDSYVSPQLYRIEGGLEVTDTFYVHHDIHRGNVFDETWGRLLASEDISAGTRIRNDFSHVLPDDLNPSNMHFLIVVYNRETFEVEQVIKHIMEP